MARTCVAPEPVRCATHTAKTNGSPVHSSTFRPGRSERMQRYGRRGAARAAMPDRRSRAARRAARGRRPRCRSTSASRGDEPGTRVPHVREQQLEQRDARHRAVPTITRGRRARRRRAEQHHASHRAVAGDREIRRSRYAVVRIARVLDARHDADIELARQPAPFRLGTSRDELGRHAARRRDRSHRRRDSS